MKTMARLTSLSLLILLLNASFLRAEEAGLLTEKQASAERQAQDLLAKGDYLAARAVYEDLLHQPDLSEEKREEILKAYEKLSMQILFSRIETPTSVFHEVVSGDSIYKIAKKHGTTVELIKKSNSLKSDMIYPGMKLKITKGTFSVKIDKSDNVLTLFLEGKPIKRYIVATGKDNGTPTGSFKVMNKLTDPTWYRAGAVVPPDSPENVLGSRWLGFDYAGYGIHGTTEPETIGQQVTSGCVRMHNRDVEEVYSIIPVGTRVRIID